MIEINKQEILDKIDSLNISDELKNLFRLNNPSMITINQTVNSLIPWGNDIFVWNTSDYWASPYETLVRGAGDCEDIAILKWFLLLFYGESSSNLKFIYCYYKEIGTQSKVPHLVLAMDIGVDKFILDVLDVEPNIKRISERSDLEIILEFDEANIYANNKIVPITPENMSKFESVKVKIWGSDGSKE